MSIKHKVTTRALMDGWMDVSSNFFQIATPPTVFSVILTNLSTHDVCTNM